MKADLFGGCMLGWRVGLGFMVPDCCGSRFCHGALWDIVMVHCVMVHCVMVHCVMVHCGTLSWCMVGQLLGPCKKLIGVGSWDVL